MIAVADPAALAKAAAERVHRANIAANTGRVAICLTGGSSPKTALSIARRPSHTAAGFRGTACTGSSATSVSCRRIDPLNNMAHGAGGLSWTAARRPPTSIRFRPTPADPDRSARRYEQRTEIILRRGRAGPCPAAVRCRADGRRPRRPYRLAVSRLSGARARPSAGWSASPRPMSSPSCPG